MDGLHYSTDAIIRIQRRIPVNIRKQSRIQVRSQTLANKPLSTPSCRFIIRPRMIGGTWICMRL
jgi:hypothetical protein